MRQRRSLSKLDRRRARSRINHAVAEERRRAWEALAYSGPPQKSWPPGRPGETRIWAQQPYGRVKRWVWVERFRQWFRDVT